MDPSALKPNSGRFKPPEFGRKLLPRTDGTLKPITYCEPKRGYLVYCPETDPRVTVDGVLATDGDVTLHRGWNLIGPISNFSLSQGNLEPAWCWDGIKFGQVAEIEPEKAYWVYSDANIVIDSGL